MTIIEALKSGKPFKSPHQDLYYRSDTDHLFGIENILADDWEVKEDKPELLPCPFCGGDAKSITYGGIKISCTKCGSSTQRCRYLDVAIDAWNKRVDTKHNEAYEQLRFGYETLLINFQDAERKAYNAGVAEVTAKSIGDITTRGIDSYDEWKRGQK